MSIAYIKRLFIHIQSYEIRYQVDIIVYMSHEAEEVIENMMVKVKDKVEADFS